MPGLHIPKIRFDLGCVLSAWSFLLLFWTPQQFLKSTGVENHLFRQTSQSQSCIWRPEIGLSYLYTLSGNQRKTQLEDLIAQRIKWLSPTHLATWSVSAREMKWQWPWAKFTCELFQSDMCKVWLVINHSPSWLRKQFHWVLNLIGLCPHRTSRAPLSLLYTSVRWPQFFSYLKSNHLKNKICAV